MKPNDAKKPRKQIPKELYLERPKLVELALKDESKFLKVMKDNHIRDLSLYAGYEIEPPLVLTTGKKVQTTALWNPLIFALVKGKTDLYTSLVKLMQGFNAYKTLNFDSSQEEIDQEDESQSMVTLLTLMVENESPLLKNLLNDFCYLIKTSHIKKLIKIMTK